MNSVGKTLLSIFLVLVVGGIGVLIYCSLPAIKGVITNNKYYRINLSYDWTIIFRKIINKFH